MKARAQSGLEYLVTYGWAIFIVVIVTAILWYMGAFDSFSFAGPVSPAGGFSTFSHLDHSVNSTYAIILFGNSLGRRLTVNIPVTVGTNDGTPDTACNTGLPLIVAPNGNFSIICTSYPQGPVPSVGGSYDFVVSIAFTDMGSGNDHEEFGYIRGKFES
ncbi:MAG: hypothetical protein ABIG96_00875 [Candidatus Micrarchaeota archaeon]